MLIKIKGKEFTGEGVYIKYNSDYHARYASEFLPTETDLTHVKFIL